MQMRKDTTVLAAVDGVYAGSLTVADVVALVNICLGKGEEGSNVGDLNNDKVVNITDVVTLLNKCLGTVQ